MADDTQLGPQQDAQPIDRVIADAFAAQVRATDPNPQLAERVLAAIAAPQPVAEPAPVATAGMRWLRGLLSIAWVFGLLVTVLAVAQTALPLLTGGPLLGGFAQLSIGVTPQTVVAVSLAVGVWVATLAWQEG